MKIEHLAIWVNDLEKMKDFYMKYFDMKSNSMYVNEKKQFSSYFLSFNSGTRIELMKRPDIEPQNSNKGIVNGLTHFAISLESKKAVEELTELLRKDGYAILGEPRTTGDGYFESVIADPEGNPVELTT